MLTALGAANVFANAQEHVSVEGWSSDCCSRRRATNNNDDMMARIRRHIRLDLLDVEVHHPRESALVGESANAVLQDDKVLHIRPSIAAATSVS